MCLDRYGHHEVIDRAHVALEMFYDFVYSHPVVQSSPDLSKKADAILKSMSQFYQMAGEAADNYDENQKQD